MNKKLEMEDEMDKFKRSLGNLTALIHTLSLTATNVNIGSAEFSRAIEATWQLSGFLEVEMQKIREMTKDVQSKDLRG